MGSKMNSGVKISPPI